MGAERKATVTYTGDGAQTKYSFPFDYLRKAFVKVQDIAGDAITELALGTDYSIDDKQVTLAKAIPSGNHLKIYRQTTTEPLVEWQDASVLRSADLSLQEVQLLHLSEETLDRVQEGGLSTDPNNSDVWDARFKRMKNLLDPKDDGDAMTLRYAKNTTNGMITNITNTGDTQVKRVTTTGDTQTKRVTDEGDTQNTRVTSTGDSYVTQMTSLKDIATTKATEASSSADLSRAWAVSKTSPDGTDSMSSMSWAEASKISASNAKTSETNAMSYMLNASSSASNAKASETKANASAVNAKASEDKAKTSENNSKVSETNAATSEQEAKTHADNAAKYDPRELIDEAYHRIKRDTAYEVGDVLTSTNLPYDVVIDVTQAGTTGAAEPDWDSIKDDIGNSQAGATSIQELKEQVALLVPTGVVMPFAGDTPPEGFLLCNGQSVSRTTYVNLFTAIGTKYGEGDDSTTFNVPNLVDKFIEGGSESGATKEAGLPNITGSWRGVNWGPYNQVRDEGAIRATMDKNYINPVGWDTDTTSNLDRYEMTNIDASRQNPVYGKSDTVQPASIVMTYIIKY